MTQVHDIVRDIEPPENRRENILWRSLGPTLKTFYMQQIVFEEGENAPTHICRDWEHTAEELEVLSSLSSPRSIQKDLTKGIIPKT